MSREPKAHFGLPWVRPWDNHRNVTWMKRKFNACQTHISIFLKDRLSTAHSTSLTMQCCDKQSIIVSNGSTRAVHGSQCKLFKHYLKLIVR